MFVPVCVLIGLSSDCDTASNTQSSHQLTSEGDALQDTRDTDSDQLTGNRKDRGKDRRQRQEGRKDVWFLVDEELKW